MQFGLKNTIATYQRCVNKMFKEQPGKTMEVYINDTVVKSKKVWNHLQDLIGIQYIGEVQYESQPFQMPF